MNVNTYNLPKILSTFQSALLSDDENQYIKINLDREFLVSNSNYEFNADSQILIEILPTQIYLDIEEYNLNNYNINKILPVQPHVSKSDKNPIKDLYINNDIYLKKEDAISPKLVLLAAA